MKSRSSSDSRPLYNTKSFSQLTIVSNYLEKRHTYHQSPTTRNCLRQKLVYDDFLDWQRGQLCTYARSTSSCMENAGGPAPEPSLPNDRFTKKGARITTSSSITKGTLAHILLDDLGIGLIAEDPLPGTKSSR